MKLRGSPAGLGLLVVAGLSLAACAPPSDVARPKTPGAKKASAVQYGPAVSLSGAWLMPDVAPARRKLSNVGESEQRLASRLRMEIRADGSLERAQDLLPIGRISFDALPARLGGGFIFVGATARGTEIWKSAGWLAKLEPLATLGRSADNERSVVAGFDRIYVKLRSGELTAIDPVRGDPIALGGLPPLPGLGDLLFLDGFRAVVDTELAGPMATFDGGANWRRLDLPSRVRSMTRLDTPDASALLRSEGGNYVLSPSGDVTFFPTVNATDFLFDPRAEVGETRKDPPFPLGSRPLRRALERGALDSSSSAVLAFEGSVYRVDVVSGRIRDRRIDAYPDPAAECDAVDFGAEAPRVGFVCGTQAGATTLYALGAELALERVARFEEPRRIAASGQGWLVVTGGCSEPAVAKDARSYCVVSPERELREVRVRGAVGAERVVALADGGVAILLPPRQGTQGQLTLLRGSGAKHIPLRMPDDAPRDIETGMWMEGFVQSSADKLSGWVEAGGPVFGVQVGLDGAVSVGPPADEAGSVLVSGRFGLAFGRGDKLLESSDYGASWQERPLPQGITLDDEPSAPRRCSALGCILPGWLRVGWGESAVPGDLSEPAAPPAAKLSSFRLSKAPLKLDCSLRGSQTPTRPDKVASEGTTQTGWLPFFGVSAPKLQKGEVGFDGGAPFDAFPFRIYAWGPKESDWSRAGRSLVRYVDKFALSPMAASAVSVSPWSNEIAAGELFGAGGWGIAWSATREAGGAGALLSACRGKVCNLFALEAEEPLLRLRTNDPAGLLRPLGGSVVRLERAWYFLAEDGAKGDALGLYRADLGNVRQVTSLPRLSARSLLTIPRLARRANSRALGLVYVVREGSFDRSGTRYVLPIDPDTGALGEPANLGRPDLADVRVTGPCREQDGWVFELGSQEATPSIKLDERFTAIEGFDARMRLDVGAACFEVASGEGAPTRSQPNSADRGGSKATGNPGFPLFVGQGSQEARREYRCRVE